MRQDIIIWDGISLLKDHPGSGLAHEHAAERTRFESVVDNIETTNPVMVELGAFWALWSIIFGKKVANARLIIVEGNREKLDVGLRNLQLNNLSATAYYKKYHHGYSLQGTTCSYAGGIREVITLHIRIPTKRNRW